MEIALIIPAGFEWEALARGALALLLSAENFEQVEVGDYSPEDAAQEFVDFLLYTFQGWDA